MKITNGRWAGLVLILLLVGVPACADDSQLKGKVVKVADGDTFTMLVNKKQYRVRLYGIDCPERGQDFSLAAKKYLSELIMHKIVVVETQSRDRYGRIVGVVTVDGKSINEILLQEGYAWHFRKYDQNPKWAKLQESAKVNRKGIWSLNNPVAPWEFRRR